MARLMDLLRRQGLAVLLTSAVLWLFLTATVPALRARTHMRRERVLAEEQLQRARWDAERAERLHEAASSDPLVQERLADSLRLSPDVPGPRVLLASPQPAASGADPGTR